MNDTDLQRPNHRILVIDDNPAIHEDLRKILARSDDHPSGLDAAESLRFGTQFTPRKRPAYELDFAHQGQEGLTRLEAGLGARRRYALAFVDVRMPPGWDGIETISHLWERDPDLQVVICTAYSDYSWDQITRKLGHSDNLLILKKPFDNVEVIQMASALTRKWHVSRQARARMQELDRMVVRRTAELRAANQRLEEEIQQRIQAERALRISEERFAKAFIASPLAIALLGGPNQQFVDANEQFLQVTGFELPTLLGRTPTELELLPGAAAGINPSRSPEDPQSVRNLPCPFRRKDGELRHGLLSTEIFHLGEVEHRLLILQDDTERQRTEERLRQALKMEAVAQLAAGVAHEFNNVHAVIQGHGTLLADSLRDPGLEESVREILNSSRRAAQLTRQLLAFSRERLLEPAPVQLNQLIEQLHPSLEQRLGGSVELVLELDRTLPVIQADAHNLEQVIHRLCDNARDAMPQGGRLTVSTQTVAIEPSDTCGLPSVRPRRYVALTVTDTGIGMDSATLTRLFEPFFTTKEIGKGTGLGLASAHGLIRQHNGWIDVRSTPGHGSSFRVLLPLDDPSTNPSPANPEAALTPAQDRPWVMLVDDEPALLSLGQRTLERAGHHVRTAASAEKALRLWEAHGSTLRQETASLRFLAKPYAPDRLLTLVQQCLDESSSGPEILVPVLS